MPKSLIRKNQLSTDIADLVRQYGSGFFVPYEAANQFTASLTGQNVVYTTGDQNISGLKSFATRPQVNGTGVLLIGEATAGGTVTNVVYTTGNQTIAGLKNFTGTLQFSGNAVATATNLASTGSTLQANINNLGTTYATVGNLASTGSTLQTSINNLSGSSVLTFGNQSITGTKTFTGIVNINSATFSTRPTVNGTGVLLNGEGSIATLPTTIVYTTGSQNVDGVKNFTGTLQFNGNTVATATNLASTGSTLQTNINNLSNTYATIPNLALTGSTLSTSITNLSGSSILTYGNQSASGNKTFLTRSVLYSGVNVNYNRDTIVKFSGTTDFTNTINSSGGVNFTSTPSLSTNPNILDYYREGVWTPVISGTTFSGIFRYGTETTGNYTKIGNTVFLQGNINITGTTTVATGSIRIIGLPFNPTSLNNINVSYWQNMNVAVNNIKIYTRTGENSLSILKIVSAVTTLVSAAGFASGTDIPSTNPTNFQLAFNGFYFTNQ